MKKNNILLNHKAVKVISLLVILVLMQIVTSSKISSAESGSDGYESVVDIDGIYYWELVFSYDNSNNSGSIVEEFSFKEETIIDTTSFRQTTVESNDVWELGGKHNFTMAWEVISASSNINYSIHRDVSKQLVEKFTVNEVKTTTETRNRKYTIGPYSKLNLYRLVYKTKGMTIKTDIFSNTAPPDVKVTIRYTTKEDILGFNELSSRLSNTYPGRDNKVEWATIRNSIISNSHKENIDQFLNLLKTMRNISPGNHNKVEWANIRLTCNEIIADWDNYTKQTLFNKLLNRLSTTHPGSSNLGEWDSVRKTSSDILTDLKMNY
jgi:hypothetical protein